uniref:Uncharacterized protein n=1 Tax=Arundo donax TaxID=35708 RepID=A0A0A9CF01_ARUDO
MDIRNKNYYIDHKCTNNVFSLYNFSLLHLYSKSSIVNFFGRYNCIMEL